MAQHKASSSPPQGAPSQTAGEFEEYIGYVIVLMIVMVGFVIFTQYAALAGRYIYAPFSVPVWAMGKNFGVFGSAAMIAFYGILCLLMALLLKFVFKKNIIFWLTYAGLFFILTFLEIITGVDSSFFTLNVTMFCNPNQENLMAIFSCQHGIEQLRTMNTSTIILVGFIPNLIIAWPTLFGLGMGFMRITNEHPFALTRRVHDVDSFIKEQKFQYAHLRFYDAIDPNKLPNNRGPLRLMDSSKKFCFDNDLISNFTIRPDLADSSSFGKLFGQTPVAPDLNFYDFKSQDLVPVLDAERFERIMSEQLGEPWSGVDNIRPAEVILMSIAIPRACCVAEHISTEEAEQVKKDCKRIIQEVWVWVSKELNKSVSSRELGLDEYPKLEEYREIVRDWINEDIAMQILREHAYVRTILYRAMEMAKEIGVLQPSNFRWLKKYDRTVWGLVQNVSRPSGFAENIGAVAHYKEERREGVAINKPNFQSAYNGLVERLRDFKYSDEIIAAWHTWKTEGDPEPLIAMNLMSPNDYEDWLDVEEDYMIEDAEYEYEYEEETGLAETFEDDVEGDEGELELQAQAQRLLGGTEPTDEDIEYLDNQDDGRDR